MLKMLVEGDPPPSGDLRFRTGGRKRQTHVVNAGGGTPRPGPQVFMKAGRKATSACAPAVVSDSWTHPPPTGCNR
jgi:hypothetical protein